MQGIELSRKYYEEYGLPAIREQFPETERFIAAGMIGAGSECLGYDDGISSDHDYEPGFCIFLPGEDVVDRRTAFLMERMYSKLPKEFMGYKRSLVQPVGGARHGVIRISDFVNEKTGTSDGVLDIRQWLTVPEQSLLELTDGEIFSDGYGELTGIRDRLAYYPDDIMKKKLAGSLLLMAQSGQYNYMRCIKHGETGAAQIAAFEFAKSTMNVIFILNRRYQPYYKWGFRALRSLPLLSIEAELLEYLITTDNDESMSSEKYDVIEGIAADVIDELAGQGLTEAICGDLEKHAYSVNDGIADSEVRNLHILAAV